MKRIVTAKRPPRNRRRKPAKTVEIVNPIVTAKKPAKSQAPWADDGQPVLEEVREFFKRMMRPPGA
jgi:hypothetical protein